MNNIIPFEYETNEIRVVEDTSGEPWWIAKDVCSVLEIVDISQQSNGLDYDEKLLRTLHVSGQNRDVWTVNEPGLYSLILRSNKPEAKKFKRWITHEVLPSIRKTGRYEVDNVTELDLIIKSAQEMKKFEARQVEHDQRLQILEAKQHQNAGETGYWTISAWCKLNNLSLSLEDSKRKGRLASRLSNEWNAPLGKVSDERFGTVNSYREDVLEEVFDPIEEHA
jgi:prophage antirepressor-like protein